MYNLEIGKMMHKIHSSNPPDNFKWPFAPLNQIHSYSTRSATRGVFVWQVALSKNGKRPFNTSWPQNLGLYWSLLVWAFLIHIQKMLQRYPNSCVLSLSKWCWCFALRICPQSSLYRKLNFSSCTYSRDFHTWTFLSLCVWFVFLYCCWCLFVLQKQCVRLSGSLLVVDEVLLTRNFQSTRTQKLPASPFQQNYGCIGWLILILLPLQTIVGLARCERVMTTREELHFSWVYTFSATRRSLRTWAPVPPRETCCDPALPAQLCLPSGSSFPRIRLRSQLGML